MLKVNEKNMNETLGVRLQYSRSDRHTPVTRKCIKSTPMARKRRANDQEGCHVILEQAFRLSTSQSAILSLTREKCKYCIYFYFSFVKILVLELLSLWKKEVTRKKREILQKKKGNCSYICRWMVVFRG